MPGSPYDISVTVRARRSPVGADGIRRGASRLLRALGWGRAALSVLLVEDAAIRKINRRYLSRDRPTDVIAFSQLEGRGPRPWLGDKPFLGDVVISVPTARRQAREFGKTARSEIMLYLCHGILHLMGVSDKGPRQAARMARLQSEALRRARVGGFGCRRKNP